MVVFPGDVFRSSMVVFVLLGSVNDGLLNMSMNKEGFTVILIFCTC